jgi:hypothetical protein
MTPQPTVTVAPRRGRSTLAVLAGLVAIIVLSLGADQVFHSLGIYPPWGVEMKDSGLFVLALSYRVVFQVFGCWLTARLAPHAPMRHAIILGIVGFVLSTVGAIASISAGNMGPSWYPIALVISSLPCAWLGGLLYRGEREG